MKYETYKNNLVNFLSNNMEDMSDIQLLKLLTNFKRQLRECEDINIKEVISTGIEIIETMIDNKIDYIEANKIRMSKAFQDFKRRKGLI